MSTQRREPVAIAVMSKINGTAVNSRVFAFPFIVSTQGCKLNGTAVNSFTLKQFTTARCNQEGSIIIFQYCVMCTSSFQLWLLFSKGNNDDKRLRQFHISCC